MSQEPAPAWDGFFGIGNLGSSGGGSSGIGSNGGGWGVFGGAQSPIKLRPVDDIEKQMNRKQQLEYERLQNKLGQVNKGVSAAMIGNGVKTELIKQAGKLGELAPKVQGYLKGVTLIGQAGGVFSAGLSAYGAYNYYSNGGKNADVFFKASLDTAFGLVGTLEGR